MKYYKECPYCKEINSASATACKNCYESLLAVMPSIEETGSTSNKYYKTCPICGEKNFLDYKDEKLDKCSLCHYEKINDVPSVIDLEVEEKNKKPKPLTKSEVLQKTDETRVKRLALRSLTDYHIVNIPDRESIVGRYGSLDPSYFGNIDHISGNHLLLYYEKGKCTIEDLNSTNGTKLNSVRLIPQQKYQINKGDVINISSLAFEVIDI